MSDQPKQTIEFLYHTPDEFPVPLPAARGIPEWMKEMSPQAPAELTRFRETSTVKRCMPFLDAMTCGYVIPVCADIQFFLRDEHHLEIETTEPMIGTQNPAQILESPMADSPVFKFNNVCLIKTPPGYSTLFLPLLNQFTLPFQILAGLVDTDTYYQQVNFPSICRMKPGERFHLKKGTPIAQAIPMKREAWETEIGTIDRAHFDEAGQELRGNSHAYREDYWSRKSYR